MIIDTLYFLGSIFLIAWALGIYKDDRISFTKNNSLDATIATFLLFGMPFIFLIILHIIGFSDYGDSNPLGFMFWWLVATSVGYTAVFVRGSIKRIFYKFALSVILLNTLYLSYSYLLVDNDKYMKMMNKSCDYGNAIACNYAEQRAAQIKEKEKFDAIMEHSDFDLEDIEKIKELDKEIERDRKVIEGIRQKYNR